MADDTLIRPISDQSERRWTVTLDGLPVQHVTLLKIEHPRFGTLAYGVTPTGYDGWSFHEVGGGGAVVVPFVILDGDVYVAVVKQVRHNQGGPVWNVPRGFIEPGENHANAARRELVEETGYQRGPMNLEALEGDPANPNSAFFETSNPEEGVKFFALEAPAADVQHAGEEIVFQSRALSPDTAPRYAEMIAEARFIHWTSAARLGDMFTVAAVSRLLAHLHDAGRVTVSVGARHGQ